MVLCLTTVCVYHQRVDSTIVCDEGKRCNECTECSLEVVTRVGEADKGEGCSPFYSGLVVLSS